MVLKIDRSADGKHIVLRLSGRMQSENLDELKGLIEQSEQVILDLEDVKLVDRDVVRFLGACEAEGTVLRHCPPYVREWIDKENSTPGSE